MYKSDTFMEHLVALADPTGGGKVTSRFDKPLDGIHLKRKSVPVIIKGKKYPSMSYAALALGVHLSTIINARNNRKLDEIQVPYHWEVEGVDFKTLREASEFFQENVSKIRKYANKIEGV